MAFAAAAASSLSGVKVHVRATFPHAQEDFNAIWFGLVDMVAAEGTISTNKTANTLVLATQKKIFMVVVV